MTSLFHYEENGKYNIMGMPFPLFMVFFAVVWGAALAGKLPNSLFGGLAFCAVTGFFLKFIVDHVTLLKKTLGLSAVSFACAALVYYHVVPESTVEIVGNVINGKVDFLGFYVGALLCGSIIGMERKLLIRAGSRYMIPVLCGVVVSYGLGALMGSVLGMDWKEVVLYIAGPIMGGGNGGGCVPMSEIYASAGGLTTEVVYARLYPAMKVGNWISLFAAIGLKCLGDRFPKTTGNGMLMKGYSGEPEKEYTFSMKMKDLGTGFLATAGFFIFGRIIGGLIPAIHAYAFTILAVTICKLFDILPEKIEFCIVKWYRLISENCTVILIAGVGISMFDLATLFETLTPSFLLICLAVVAGAIIGAGFGGILVKFFFVESAITAGLCMSNGGGNGDILILSSAERMELMSFAQISSRLGGAVILVIQSVLATMLLS